MTNKRSIFFVSDGTGITAETLGLSLLSQFENIEFEKTTIPYVNTIEKAEEVIKEINHVCERDQLKPVVFATLVDQNIHNLIKTSNAVFFDFLATFIAPLEKALECQSSHTMGRSHGMQNYENYMIRINAVNFALSNDDGGNVHQYDKADFILVGVSRSGKTPTCLYLALQFGISAANYPLTEEDIEKQTLPTFLKKYKSKLFGLTIDPERLSQIRQERRPNSRYASIKQCLEEVQIVEKIFKSEHIPYLNTTKHSIEEIATAILLKTGIKRRLL